MSGVRQEAAPGFGLWHRLFGERSAAKPAAVSPGSADPIADATLLALARRGVRRTPEAYSLWYRHLAGERPDLSRRLEDLEARGETFDPPLIAELYERYLGAEPAVVQLTAASEKVERLLAELAHDLDGLEADAKSRGDRLDALGAELSHRNAEPEAALRREAASTCLRSLVERILAETGAMRAAAYRLQRRAVDSAGEVARLRATIEAAGLGEAKDPVTGVEQQKALQRALRRAVAASEGDGSAAGTCFLIVDLDGFGRFNTAHGRRLGDLVLEATARHLALAIKRGDTIGRLPGAAFGIVLARTGLAGGEALAQRLCQRVAGMRLDPVEAEPGRSFILPPVTVAIGVAAWHDGEPLARLVGRAERARTIAKQAGGNRVVSERATRVVGRPKA